MPGPFGSVRAIQIVERFERLERLERFERFERFERSIAPAKRSAGSRVLARRAGSHTATNETIVSTSGITMNTAGSRACTS